jgi:dihydrofolate reductase
VVSLDGYYADVNGEMGWAHKHDAEWTEFSADNAKGGGELVFGRVTYDMMAGYWPSPAAAQNMPVVAERMNALPKTVFSRTLDKAAWRNTVVKSDLVAEMRAMKNTPGDDMAILGSGSIVTQLTQARLIDELQIAISPLILGGGKRLFAGVTDTLPLKLLKSRTFENGNVVLWYAPA